ncbi:MAG: tail fiber assembly protein [Enterovibrio sp.]
MNENLATTLPENNHHTAATLPEVGAVTLPEPMEDEIILDGTADDNMLVEDEVMRCFKNFTQYEPVSGAQKEKAAQIRALFLRCETGEDWYEVQRQFKSWTVKFCYDDTGVIRAKSLDVTGLWPLDMSVAEVEQSDVTEQLMRDTGSNFMYKNGEIVLRTYTDEEIKEQEKRRINQRLKEISEEMEYLQDAVDLEMATEEEKAQLLALKRERVELKRRLQEMDTEEQLYKIDTEQPIMVRMK